MKQQGKRSSLTSGQLAQKLEVKNPISVLVEVECGLDQEGFGDLIILKRLKEFFQNRGFQNK